MIQYTDIAHKLVNQGYLYPESLKNADALQNALNASRPFAKGRPTMVAFAKPPQSGKTTDMLAHGLLHPKRTLYIPSLTHTDFKDINDGVLRRLNREVKRPYVRTLSMAAFLNNKDALRDAHDFLGGDIERFIIDESHWGSNPSSRQHNAFLKIIKEYPSCELIFVSATPWSFLASKLDPENKDYLSWIQVLEAAYGENYCGLQDLYSHSSVQWVDIAGESPPEEEGLIHQASEHLLSRGSGAFLHRLQPPRENIRARELCARLSSQYPDIDFRTINSDKSKGSIKSQWEDLSDLCYSRRCFVFVTGSGIAGTDFGDPLKENIVGVYESLNSVQGLYQGLVGRIFKYNRQNFDILIQANVPFVRMCVKLEEDKNNLSDANLAHLHKDLGLNQREINISTNLVAHNYVVTWEHQREFYILDADGDYPLARYNENGDPILRYGADSSVFPQIKEVFERDFRVSLTNSSQRMEAAVRDELAAEHLNASSRNHADYILRKKFHGGECRYIATKDASARFAFKKGALNETYLESQQELEALLLDSTSALHKEVLISVQKLRPLITSEEMIEAHESGKLVMLSMKRYLDNPLTRYGSRRHPFWDEVSEPLSPLAI